MRYAGIRNNRICLVSDEPFHNSDMRNLEIPAELSHIPSKDLVNCRVRDGKITCKLAKNRLSN